MEYEVLQVCDNGFWPFSIPDEETVRLGPYKTLKEARKVKLQEELKQGKVIE